MGLRDLIPTAEVKVSDAGSFSVRGFSPNDTFLLYHRHRGQLAAMFEQFAGEVQKKGKKGKGDVNEDLIQVGTSLIGNAPQVMAEVIVLAMGVKPENEDFDAEVRAALDLPAGVQMDALQKIADLTFTSDMPPGKFLAVVVQLLQSSTAAISGRET